MNQVSDNTVSQIFDDSIHTLQNSADSLTPSIQAASELMVDALVAGNKILVCGNGGSASDAMHFSGELLNRFVVERRPLPAITLAGDVGTITAIGNDYDFDQIFSKQVTALGNPGDLLLAITTSGNSGNVLKAIDAAHEKQMRIIALSGNGGGKLSGIIQPDDINICVPSAVTARIQEVHGLVIHCFCEIIDQHFSN